MESFPSGVVPHYGINLLREGIEPLITYTTPDKKLAFYLQGGMKPFPGVTEGVILADGMDGLHPIFNHLDHKGARQDGATWTDTVYDPAEMTMKVTITARTPEEFRRIARKWFAAWDPENPGTLSWVTPDGGEWWCTPRLFRPPPEQLERGYSRTCKQTFTWPIRNDDAFWRSYDSVSEFGLEFQTALDEFNRADDGTLGINWTQTYTGPGGGVCTTDPSANGGDPGRARWAANDPDTTFTGRKGVVIGPFKDYHTSADNQVVTFTVGNTPEFTVGTGAANHVWGRMGRNPDGTWDGNGVRASIGWGFCQISMYVNFVEVGHDRSFVLIPPLANEEFVFVVGTDDNPRRFILKRNNFNIVDLTDQSSDSMMGVNYRGVGFGLQAGGAILTQATPAQVKQVKSDGVILDSFNVNYQDDLGPSWPLLYGGTGPGYVHAVGGHTTWVDTALGRKVVNRWLGANEVQTVTVYGTPSTWNLTFNGTETTSSLTGVATAAAVTSALEALPSIQVGDVTVSDAVMNDDSSYTYTVAFQGNYAKSLVPEMKGSAVLGGTDPYITVATTTEGAPAVTDTDFQVVSVKLGAFFQFPFPDAAYIDIWARMDTNDAAPTGIRLRIGPQWVQLHRFNAGVGTLLKQTGLTVLPLWNETWSLVCGRAGEPRTFVVKRGKSTLFTYKETGTGSALGSGYRHAGFGMESGDGVLAQNIPPSILKWTMGDNAAIKQSGHLTLTNFGDQPAWPTLVAYGPGTFTFGNGPDKDPTIVFGPLKEGQVAVIESHPGKRGVYDISTDVPRTDKLYSLLKGRWSNSIPPRNLDGPAEPAKIAVSIEGGDYNTKLQGSITPHRRWPE